MEIRGIRATNRGKVIFGVLLAVLLGFLYVSISWFVDGSTYVTADDAKITGDILSASPRISGKIAVMRVKNGDIVKKGDMLFSLETDQINAQINQAEANLGIAKARLARAVGEARGEELSVAESMVEQANAAFNGAVASRESLRTTLSTMENSYGVLLKQMSAYKKTPKGELDPSYAMTQLNSAYMRRDITDAQYTVGAETLQQLFGSKLQLETDINRLRGELKELDASVSGSKAGVKGAESKLKLLKNGASSKDIEILVSSVKAAQAAYDLAKLSLNYAIVRAPSNGTVVQINSHADDIIAPGLSAISLIDFSKLAVTAFVSEDDVAKIKLGNEVKLSVDALSGKTFKGKVKEIGETTASVWNLFGNSNEAGNVDKINQAVPVVIGFDYTGNKVIPGMSATVKIKISK